MLEETHYNTVNLFLDFYNSFKRTRRSDLKSFFQFYDIPINRRHHMCVSLAMEIMSQSTGMFPELAEYMYLVSCEEQVEGFQDYIETCEQLGLSSPDARVEKEHTMAVMKISIGDREGIMLLDPGYHVARAVTIMKDQLYPHTGWFTQSDEKHCKREYCYNLSVHSSSYVEWKERETRGEKQIYNSSMVYVERPYRTAIDVTVRRNLVYDFRSLLARDAKGRVVAGVYFPLTRNTNEAHFTLFYAGPNGQNVKVKLLFSVFKGLKIPDHVHAHMEQLAPQLNIPQPDLVDLMKSLAEVVHDQDFVHQVLAINDEINSMAADN